MENRNYSNLDLYNEIAQKMGYVGEYLHDVNLLLNIIAASSGQGGVDPEEVEAIIAEYNKDNGITKTISLTQAEYDALVEADAVEADVFYSITDAESYYLKKGMNENLSTLTLKGEKVVMELTNKLALENTDLLVHNGFITGEHNNNPKNHAIELGGENKDRINFYDWGAEFNFIKSRDGVDETIFTIDDRGVWYKGDGMATNSYVDSNIPHIVGGDGISVTDDEYGQKVISLKGEEVQPNDEIWYTSTDGNVVVPTRTTAFTKNIISNTYVNGKGIIKFDGDVNFKGTSAFSGKTTLESVTFPNSVTSIGTYAFRGCDGLTSVGGKGSGASVEIPNSVTSISGYVFDNCSKLTSVEIPNSVTKISSYVFAECTSLTSVTIPNSVKIINNYTFYRCSSLTSIEIPNSVTSIGENVFESCSNLTSVTIPNSVTSIDNGAFRNCSKLTSVTIPNSVTSLGNAAFRGCSKLTSVTIPNSVTSIGGYAFQECSNLTSVTIDNGVTRIGDGAFQSCTNLTSVTIPSSVTYIGYSAFSGVLSNGTLYCDEDWFNNLNATSKSYLYNVANWTRLPLPKTIEERVEALENKLDGLSFVALTQEEYDALAVKDNNTIYLIRG